MAGAEESAIVSPMYSAAAAAELESSWRVVRVEEEPDIRWREEDVGGWPGDVALAWVRVERLAALPCLGRLAVEKTGVG